MRMRQELDRLMLELVVTNHKLETIWWKEIQSMASAKLGRKSSRTGEELVKDGAMLGGNRVRLRQAIDRKVCEMAKAGCAGELAGASIEVLDIVARAAGLTLPPAKFTILPKPVWGTDSFSLFIDRLSTAAFALASETIPATCTARRKMIDELYISFLNYERMLLQGYVPPEPIAIGVL